MKVRRLGPGDQHILAMLARDDEDFDLGGRGGEREPLSPTDSRAYLGDPRVLHWIASDEDGCTILGHMYCLVVPKRSGDGREILLYEIGVRAAQRRTGVGRALVQALDAWMSSHHVREAWVLADNPGAVEFYRACGFTIGEQPVYLSRP